MAYTREEYIEKIRGLLAIANDSRADANEAIAAAAMAQKLMAKYDIDMESVETSDEPELKEIGEEMVDISDVSHVSTSWKSRLAVIIANNFRCKVYFIGTKKIIFYGHATDARVASNVFSFLFATGTKLGIKECRKASKEGKPTRGVATTYLVGFCKGIEDVLNEQCKALMIITSPEVEEGWKEKSKTMGKKTTKLKCSNDKSYYEQGRVDGRLAMSSRQIEG